MKVEEKVATSINIDAKRRIIPVLQIDILIQTLTYLGIDLAQVLV
jgi:hypothetical protein